MTLAGERRREKKKLGTVDRGWLFLRCLTTLVIMCVKLQRVWKPRRLGVWCSIYDGARRDLAWLGQAVAVNRPDRRCQQAQLQGCACAFAFAFAFA